MEVKLQGRHLWNVSVLAISSVGKNVPFFHSPDVTMPTPAARAHPSLGSCPEGVLLLRVRLWCWNRLRA